MVLAYHHWFSEWTFLSAILEHKDMYSRTGDKVICEVISHFPEEGEGNRWVPNMDSLPT